MGLLKRAFGPAWLGANGWTTEGDRPPGKCVLIAAPHTSNWDLPFMLAFASIFDIEIRWAGKDSLFEFPLGPLMRGLGGVAIVRHEKRNRVESLAALFDEYDDLVLVMPTEGTRSRVEHWRSGFYHIAALAKVPIVCGFMDYGRKVGGFGPAIHPSGDIEADMDRIRAFYEGKQGYYPDKFGPVRLRNETNEPADTSER